MITQTLTGVIYSTMAASQAATYQQKPNALISALRNENLQHQHTEALTQRIVDKTRDGKAFADAAAEDVNWYEPPRGHIIDEWA